MNDPEQDAAEYYAAIEENRARYQPAILVVELLGEIARWAVRQSPYHAPEGLVEVMIEFQKRLDGLRITEPGLFPLPDFILSKRKDLERVLWEDLCSIPQVMRWNERKNGRLGHASCSRYEKPAPDDDFIDLHALTRNIATECANMSVDLQAQTNPEWEKLGPQADIKLPSKDDYKPLNINPK